MIPTDPVIRTFFLETLLFFGIITLLMHVYYNDGISKSIIRAFILTLIVTAFTADFGHLESPHDQKAAYLDRIIIKATDENDVILAQRVLQDTDYTILRYVKTIEFVESDYFECDGHLNATGCMTANLPLTPHSVLIQVSHGKAHRWQVHNTQQIPYVDSQEFILRHELGHIYGRQRGTLSEDVADQYAARYEPVTT